MRSLSSQAHKFDVVGDKVGEEVLGEGEQLPRQLGVHEELDDSLFPKALDEIWPGHELLEDGHRQLGNKMRAIVHQALENARVSAAHKVQVLREGQDLKQNCKA